MLVGAATQRGQRLVASDREQPGGDLGLGLEALGLPPHVEEHLAHEVLGQRLVPGQANDEAVHPHIVPSVEHLHRALVAVGDEANQCLVGCLLDSRPKMRRRDIAQHILVLHDDPL